MNSEFGITLANTTGTVVNEWFEVFFTKNTTKALLPSKSQRKVPFSFRQHDQLEQDAQFSVKTFS